MEKALAIITARGKSKRIPRKNIKEFCGKPMIAYSIEAALASEIFDEVMVSTEDMEIAELAKRYGARVPFMRSQKTADDYATTAEVLLEVLEQYKRQKREFLYACCIYPTAPFVTGEKLKAAMGMLQDADADSVIPVTEFSFPPMRGMYIQNGKVQYVFPEYSGKRSQDIEKMYHDCGQFYCFRTEAFVRHKKLVMDKTKAMVITELEVQDIDNEVDWKLAELKYRLMQERTVSG